MAVGGPANDENSFPLSADQVRMLIRTESMSSMIDNAIDYCFPEKPRIETRMLRLLERIPTIRAVHGHVASGKLVDVVRADAELDVRSGWRALEKAVQDGWVLQKRHKTDARITDNDFNYERRIPERFERLTTLQINIAKVVEMQLQNPFDLNAGRDLLPREVFLHPLEAVLQCRAEKEKEECIEEQMRMKKGKHAGKRGGSAAAAAVLLALATALGVATTTTHAVDQQKVVQTMTDKGAIALRKSDGWKKVEPDRNVSVAAV